MADYYCNCKGCRHVDPNERSGYKWYCTWYRSYEDPDRVHECVHFENQDGGGCFLTTACCRYRGLPDDCAELTQLRRFRDEQLMTTEDGRRLVEEYYRIAPGIVAALDSLPGRDAVYEYIYSVILTVTGMLARGEYDAATAAYRDMVLRVRAEAGV